MVVALALLVGVRVSRWWLLALPPLAVAATVGGLALAGSAMSRDTPVPFLLLVVELFLAVGMWLGTHRAATASTP